MADFIGYRDDQPMTQVLDRLFLGGFLRAEALAMHNPEQISCVVNCTTEPLHLPVAVSPRDTSGFEVLQLNQLDGHEWSLRVVLEALEWIRVRLSEGRRVLVHCHAGVSRSPVLVAAYLYTCGWNFLHALHHVKTLRPCVNPTGPIVNSMMRFFGIGRR